MTGVGPQLAGGTGLEGGLSGGGSGVEAPVEGLTNIVHWWDFSNAASRTDSGGAVTSITSLVGANAVMATAAGTINRTTTVGSKGLTCGSSDSGANTRMTSLTTAIGAQPIGVSLVGEMQNTSQGVWFDFGLTNRPHAYQFGTWTMHAGTALNGGASNTSTHTFYFEFNGASSRMFIDGVLVATGNAGTSIPQSQMALFNVYPGSVGGAVTIGELLVATGVQTLDAIAAEHARLTAKWV